MVNNISYKFDLNIPFNPSISTTHSPPLQSAVYRLQSITHIPPVYCLYSHISAAFCCSNRLKTGKSDAVCWFWLRLGYLLVSKRVCGVVG
jgi:hypothetical protein